MASALTRRGPRWKKRPSRKTLKSVLVAWPQIHERVLAFFIGHFLSLMDQGSRAKSEGGKLPRPSHSYASFTLDPRSNLRYSTEPAPVYIGRLDQGSSLAKRWLGQSLLLTWPQIQLELRSHNYCFDQLDLGSMSQLLSRLMTQEPKIIDTR